MHSSPSSSTSSLVVVVFMLVVFSTLASVGTAGRFPSSKVDPSYSRMGHDRHILSERSILGKSLLKYELAFVESDHDVFDLPLSHSLTRDEPYSSPHHSYQGGVNTGFFGERLDHVEHVFRQQSGSGGLYRHETSFSNIQSAPSSSSKYKFSDIEAHSFLPLAYRVPHAKTTKLNVQAMGKDVSITLNRNDDLFAARYRQERQVYDGAGVRFRSLEPAPLSVHEVPNCYYLGSIDKVEQANTYSVMAASAPSTEHAPQGSAKGSGLHLFSGNDQSAFKLVAVDSCHGGFSGVVVDKSANMRLGIKPALNHLKHEDLLRGLQDLRVHHQATLARIDREHAQAEGRRAGDGQGFERLTDNTVRRHLSFSTFSQSIAALPAHQRLEGDRRVSSNVLAAIDAAEEELRLLTPSPQHDIQVNGHEKPATLFQVNTDRHPHFTSLSAANGAAVAGSSNRGTPSALARLHLVYNLHDVDERAEDGSEYVCGVGNDHAHASGHLHTHTHAHDNNKDNLAAGPASSLSSTSASLAKIYDQAKMKIESSSASSPSPASSSSSPRPSPPSSPSSSSSPTLSSVLERMEKDHHWDASPSSFGGKTAGRSSLKLQTLRPEAIYLESLTVNDNLRYTQKQGNTETDAAALYNIVSANYIQNVLRPTVTVVLVGMITWIKMDPYTTTIGKCSTCGKAEVSVTELLASFHAWRQIPENTMIHDNAQLLSGFDFEGSTLGFAGVAVMCRQDISGGVDETSKKDTTFSGGVVAHEIGHNFSMQHDSVGNTCTPSGNIMNAIVSGAKAPTEFSDCSKLYLFDYVDNALYCLLDVPVRKYTAGAQVCGNGITEPGETCDCGQQDCTKVGDACCDGNTCKLKSGASCSQMNGCCDSQCKIVEASSRKVCRRSVSDCDIDEICDGVKETCPLDYYKGAGAPCTTTGGYGEGSCFVGFCHSHLQQCRLSTANFKNAPYDACNFYEQKRLNVGNYCKTLFCSKSNSMQCTYFQISGQLAQVEDGVPCGYGSICYKNECVPGDAIVSKFQWNTTAWSYCTECNTIQRRNITCVDRSVNAVVGDDVCAQGKLTPEIVRMCVNEAVGCFPAGYVMAGNMMLFGVQVPKSTVIMSVSSVGVMCLFILFVCYYSVTRGSDTDEATADILEFVKSRGDEK